MTGLQDQIEAATAQARQRFATALGLPPDRYTRGSSPFLDEFLDRYMTPDTPRCAHLRARPIQPAYLALPFAAWRCQECMSALAAQRPRPRADEIEEYTCDRCRRYLPTEELTPAVLRQDMWIVAASLCARCKADGKRLGAQELALGDAPESGSI